MVTGEGILTMRIKFVNNRYYIIYNRGIEICQYTKERNCFHRMSTKEEYHPNKEYFKYIIFLAEFDFNGVGDIVYYRKLAEL